MQDERPRSDLAVSILRWATLAVSVGTLALVAFVVAQRIGYPYELEWLEGAVLQHVGEVRAGRSPYAEPSMRFSPFYYTPLYYYLAAPTLSLFGEGFLGPRLVSLAASIGCIGLVFAFVVGETRDRSAAFAAGGVFAGGYGWSGRWFDVARIDMLFLGLVLAGAYALRFERGRARAALAGALLAAAVLTKQTAILVALPLLGEAALRRRLVAAGTFAGVLVVAATYLELDSRGWFRYCLFELGRGHAIVPARLFSFWTNDLVLRLPFVLLLVGGALASELRKRDAFYPLFALGTLAAAYLPRIKIGGYDNNLLPLFALGAVGAGVALARLVGSVSDRRRVRLAWGLAFAQLAWSLPRESPLGWVPTEQDRAAGDALVRMLGAAAGEVLVPTAPYLAERAGKRGSAHHMNLRDLVWSNVPAREQVLDSFREGLLRGRWERVVLSDGHGAWLVDLPPTYAYAGRVVPEGAFEPRSGSREFVPAHLYLRRP